jgi:phthiocerol/phenolphthiocerol synthesis type-I polyketide synthase E
MTININISESDIAIIGMSCRFPGANDVDGFWQNLRDGVESISFFSNDELEQTDPTLLSNPNYVRAGAVLPNIEEFDASFFGYSAPEAEIMDPQQRIFLECAWEALESAGYNPETYQGLIGVYSGSGMNTYLLNNVHPNRGFFLNRTFLASASDLQVRLGNGKDYQSTRVSYKLNLTGPSINIQTACSTALVTVHMACQSLLNGECDIVLAGGIAVCVPQKMGYLYQDDMIWSPDGHCRAFDAEARGTVFGNGGGIVVLKLLRQAIADGDCIHAVIKGSAINNDGALKVNYTAPSVEGQAAVISEALAIAQIDPSTVTYIETHGTGTTLGDPVEITALTKAFRESTDKNGFCAIGSVKTNIGHLGEAAGIAGLLKTVLAIKHKKLPPSLHFRQPNPNIDFANSPFYVNTTLSEWRANGTPRRAGVSSFGMGGTNAHVVLEETPAEFEYKSQESGESGRKFQLLVLSAKTETALDTATANLVEHLNNHPDLNLADVVYTLGVGRKAFNHRRILVCRDREDAVNTLSTEDPTRVFVTNVREAKNRPVAFMFSGQGSQYVNMALELYQEEPAFTEQIDLCAELLKPHLGLDLRDILYPNEEQAELAVEQLNQTAIAQPALFTIEYALAKLWMSWGVHPKAAIGHSIGEYVAATFAGVFSLEEALSLVAARGMLTSQMPPGSMLAVPLPQQEVQPLLNNKLSLAAINGSSLCTVSGATDAIVALQQQLQAQGVECRLLYTSHAFHSYMMEPILETFTLAVKKVNLKPPQIPYISNVTGTWITAESATNPSYWARHLRQTVLFSSGLQRLLQEQDLILLEVGPGRTLTTIAKKHVDKAAEQVILSSLRHPQDQQSDVAFLLNALGKLWLAGIQVDWSEFYACSQRYRLPLPTYPFERQRYWIEPPKQAGEQKELNSHFYNAVPKSSLDISAPAAFTVCRDDAVKKDVETLDAKSPKKDFSSLHSTRPNLPNSYVAPRNQLERTITEIWQKFFRIEQVGIHDDFFELGGDSLLAVHLISKLCETLKTELSSHSLLGSPTIAGLAELIEQTVSASTVLNRPPKQALPESLVEIKSGNFKQPLFLVHPSGGHVYIYRDLVNYLGSDYSVYGLQAQGIDGKTQILTKVEEMATKYIEALRFVQPNGPYFLGGASFGGTVAFEMAQQLLALGEQVALLALIDTPGPGQMPVKLEDNELQLLAYLLNAEGNFSFSAEDFQQMEPDERLLQFLDRFRHSMRLPADYGLAELRFFLHLIKVDVQALRNYTPRTYPGRVIFFRANDQDAINPQNPELAWVNLATGGLNIHEVPGNHITMNYAPNAQVIAEHLRAYLFSLSSTIASEDDF